MYFLLVYFFFYSRSPVGGSWGSAASLHSRYLINIGAEGNDVLASAILFFRFLKNLATSTTEIWRKTNFFPPLSLFLFSDPLRQGANNASVERVTSLRSFLSFFLVPPLLSLNISFLQYPISNITTDSKIISFARGPISGSLRMNGFAGQKVGRRGGETASISLEQLVYRGGKKFIFKEIIVLT